MPTGGYYRIGEIAAAYGVSLRTLRLYEERELLVPLKVSHSRYYTDKDKLRLELIIKAKQLGFSLSEIWRLIDSAQKWSSDSHLAIEAMISKEEISRQLEELHSKRHEIRIALAELEAILDLKSNTKNGNV